MDLYLGTHHPNHLQETAHPLFVSHSTLRRYKSFKRALGPWCGDSMGFMALSQHGKWPFTAKEYASSCIRYRDEIGNLRWMSPMDWMCEPMVLAKTGKTVREHQELTIASYQELTALGAPVIPVLQGWCAGDYDEHVEMYDRAGIDLRREKTVALGSVCRRQSTMRAQVIVRSLVAMGLKLHTFGFKKTGLLGLVDLFTTTESEGGGVVSSDTLAWSYHARREPPRDECKGKHMNCANCLPFALEWRSEFLGQLGLAA